MNCKILVALLVLLPRSGASQAVEKPWPPHAAEARFVQTKTSDLPQALRDALLRTDEFTQGTEALPEVLQVARIDVNGDRVDELLVQSPQPYSGGPMMSLWMRQGDKLAQIAWMQGTVYFASRVNGYFEIVGQSRGGAGAYTRQLLRYQGGQYHCVRLTDYQMVDGKLQFVRERDPGLVRGDIYSSSGR